MKKKLENSFVGFLYKILKVIVTIIILIILLVILIQRVSNNKISLGGYQVYSIITGSMEPKYKVGDVILVKEVDLNQIKKGDDLTYLGKEGNFSGKIVSHQVIGVNKSHDGYSFRTKGMNNPIEDPLVQEDQVLGIAIHKFVILSFIGRIMSTAVGYFGLFVFVIILVSIQIVKIIFDGKEDEEDENGEEEGII